MPAEAVELFRERAEAVTGRQVEEGPTVRDLCERLDHLPLALELAAAQLETVQPDGLLESLFERLERGEGPRDLPDRQRTLQRTLDWSYDLLDGTEQIVFARLGIFSGGCSAVAAAVIAGADESVLGSLARKSLVSLNRAGRVQMLETIHAYACEHLGADREVAARAHADHFVRLAEEAAPEFRGEQAESLGKRLDLERANFEAALTWLAGADPVSALRLVEALWVFWIGHGYLRDAERWFDRLLDSEVDAPAELLAGALVGGGAVAAGMNDFATARARLERGLEIRRSLGDDGAVARVLANLGQLEELEGNLDRSEDLRREAISLLEAIGDETQALVSTKIGLANVQTAKRDFAVAARSFEDISAHALRIGDRWAVAAALDGQGTIAREIGDFRRAGWLEFQALALLHKLGEHIAFIDVLAETTLTFAAATGFEAAAQLIGAIGVLSEECASREGEVTKLARVKVAAALGEERLCSLEAAGRRMDEEAVLAFVESSFAALETVAAR